MFRRNNRTWCKGLVWKASKVASHQTRWYKNLNKRLFNSTGVFIDYKLQKLQTDLEFSLNSYLILYKLSSSVKRQNERCFKYNQTSFWQLLLSTLQISLQISPMKINLCWTRKFNNAGEGWQEKYIQCLYFFRKDFLRPNGNLHFKVCFWPLKYLSEQGGLNKNEIQLNLCKIFSILIFNEPYLFP